MRKLTRVPQILCFCVLAFLWSCSGNKIETGKTLKAEIKAYIHSLNLLDKDETIYKFYSEYKDKVAGNFFTDRRVAKYWINGRDTTQEKIEFAYYPEIVSIDTVYHAGATYCPYMLVKKNDGTTFKVCVDGKREEIKAFFEDAIRLWNQKKADPSIGWAKKESQTAITKKIFRTGYMVEGAKPGVWDYIEKGYDSIQIRVWDLHSLFASSDVYILKYHKGNGLATFCRWKSKKTMRAALCPEMNLTVPNLSS
jgi:hypothetical protein